MIENVPLHLRTQHSYSLIRIFTGRILKANAVKFLNAGNEYTGQTYRLI